MSAYSLAAREPLERPDVCVECESEPWFPGCDFMCRQCWDEINGQFGVGA